MEWLLNFISGLLPDVFRAVGDQRDKGKHRQLLENLEFALQSGKRIESILIFDGHREIALLHKDQGIKLEISRDSAPIVKRSFSSVGELDAFLVKETKFRARDFLKC